MQHFKIKTFKTRFCFRILFFICLHFQLSKAQSLWQGQFHSYRIVFEGKLLDKNNDSIQVKLPELGMNIKATLKINANDSVYINDKIFGITFKGKIDRNTSLLSGVFNHYSIPNKYLEFKNVEKIQPLYFKQHPQEPLPYQNIDITFLGNKTKLTYGGTLCIPEKIKKYPLVILLSGTGQNDRNYTYFGREFFTVLADYLARNGIASLRIDDRGIGKTTGDFEKSTTGDFADDTDDAITFLKSMKSLDTSFLGLLGHSEGGMIASIVSARNPNVKFMISLSGVGVSGLEMLNLQNRAVLKSYNFSDEVVDKQMELYNILFKAVFDTKDEESVKPILETKLKEWMQKQDSTMLKKIQLWDGRDQTFLYRYSRDADKSWYRFTIHYNPAIYLPKITFPVLIVNGDKDIQVPATENINSFKKYLKSKDLTTKVYPGLNHMFQHCTTCTQKEIKELDEVIAVEVLSDVANWIKQRFKK